MIPSHFRVFSVFAIILILGPTLIMGDLASARAGTVGAQMQSPVLSVMDDGVNATNLVQHVYALSSMPNLDEPSRFTGYDGFYEAAEYISEVLSSYGYEPQFEYFNATVLVDGGAKLTVFDEEVEQLEVKLYPLTSNTVQLSSLASELEGKLIYGGTCDYSELNGKDVDGSIVLCEYNSRWLWKNAAILGAKAIVFIEPEDTTRAQSEFKWMKVPVHIPRLYIRREDGLRLREMLSRSQKLEATVESSMRWENRRVANIIATREGTDFPYERIVVTASYDSYSVVPSISPGATEALNVAGLLELARYFSSQDSPRSIVFAFLAGHGQGLWGAREFVDNHFEEIGIAMKLLINLDLSYESKHLAFYARGNVYAYTTYIESTSFGWISDRLTRYRDLLSEQIGDEEFHVVNGMFVTEPIFEDAPLRFDSDPFTLAGGVGVTFHTTNSIRIRQMTPADSPDHIDFDNVVPQLGFILAVVDMLTNEPSLPVLGAPTRVASDRGFSSLVVVVGEYNITTATYDPFEIPNLIVHVQWMETTPSTLAQMGRVTPPRTFDIYIKPTEDFVRPDGSIFEDVSFTLKGVKPYTNVRVEAYALNETTSMIEYATDFGVYGLGKGYPTAATGALFWINPEPSTGRFLQWLPTFRCGSIVLYGVVDPASSARITFNVLNFNFMAHSWHLTHSEDVFEGDAVIFVPPNLQTELVLRYGAAAGGGAAMAVAGEITRYPLAVLANMSREHHEGLGYKVSAGQQLVITNTPLDISRQLQILTQSRTNVTSAFHVYSAQVQTFLPLGLDKIDVAEDAFKEKDYEAAMSASVASWAYLRSTYVASMGLILDVINTVAFFFLLTIPFAFLIQKLFFPRQIGFRRLLLYIVFFLASVGVLWLFHPGFHIASNVYMILVSSTVGVFAIFTTMRLFSYVSETAEARRASLLGPHFSGYSRSTALTMAVTTGIENMRKRRFRTALTLLSLLIMTVGMITLTSGSFQTLLWPTKHIPPGGVPYNGLELMDPNFSPQAEEMKMVLRGLYSFQNATVVPRTWLVAPGGLGFTLEGGVVVEGILGLTPNEVELTALNKAILEGRWFEEDDFTSCLLGSTIARALGKEVGDTLDWVGLDLTIVGVFDETIFSSLRDLNFQFVIAPVSFLEGTPQPISVESTLIVPYRLLVEQFNLYPYTISVKFEDGEQALSEGYKLALQTVSFDIYVGAGDEITVYSPRVWYGVTGMSYLVVPFVIVAITVLNVMVASVYARIREIGIYGVVGLNPTHVTGLFLAEAMLYAVVSSIGGYMTSMVVLGLLDTFRLIPPEANLNYASTFIFVALGLIMATAIGSTLYPAIAAGRIVTPSLLRKWKMSSSPVGDDWTMPLPFSGTVEDAGAQLLYLKEFADTSTAIYGRFAASDATYIDEGRVKHLRFVARLAPFDAGITQEVTITSFRPDPSKAVVNFRLNIHRLTGHMVSWQNLNRYFVDQIRKQFLIYRSLPTSDKQGYIDQAKNV